MERAQAWGWTDASERVWGLTDGRGGWKDGRVEVGRLATKETLGIP